MSLGISPRILSVFLFFVVAGTLLTTGFACAGDSPAGKWIAEIATGRGNVVFLVELEQTEDGWRGQFTPPRVSAVPFESIEIDGVNITAKVEGPGGRIDTIKGEFRDEFERLIVDLQITNRPAQELKFRRFRDITKVNGIKRFPVGAGPSGFWRGTVVGSDGLEFDVDLTVDKNGDAWLANISDPTTPETPAENLTVSETRISFTFRPENAPFPSSFAGSYIAAKDRINGTVSMRGNSRFIRFKRVPGSFYIKSSVAGGEPIEPLTVRHPYHFAVSGRVTHWAALHMVQDETYNINNITVGDMGFDGSIRYNLMDPLTLLVRGFRGGLGFTDEQMRLDNFTSLGLSEESYLSFGGGEFGLIGYLGNVMMKNSKFNPYVSATIGTFNWELTKSGRGSDILIEGNNYFNGNGLCIAMGMGTEYELSDRMDLEFEVLWRYFSTADEIKWENKTELWDNTHAWTISLGLSYSFLKIK